MLAKQKISKKKLIIYIIIIVIIVLGNAFIYYKGSRPSQLDLDLATGSFDLEDSQAATSKERLNTQTKSVLEHNVFIALEKIGDWPVIPRGVGKVNPFAPFFNQ